MKRRLLSVIVVSLFTSILFSPMSGIAKGITQEAPQIKSAVTVKSKAITAAAKVKSSEVFPDYLRTALENIPVSIESSLPEPSRDDENYEQLKSCQTPFPMRDTVGRYLNAVINEKWDVAWQNLRPYLDWYKCATPVESQILKTGLFNTESFFATECRKVQQGPCLMFLAAVNLAIPLADTGFPFAIDADLVDWAANWQKSFSEKFGGFVDNWIRDGKLQNVRYIYVKEPSQILPGIVYLARLSQVRTINDTCLNMHGAVQNPSCAFEAVSYAFGRGGRNITEGEARFASWFADNIDDPNNMNPANETADQARNAAREAAQGDCGNVSQGEQQQNEGTQDPTNSQNPCSAGAIASGLRDKEGSNGGGGAGLPFGMPEGFSSCVMASVMQGSFQNQMRQAMNCMPKAQPAYMERLSPLTTLKGVLDPACAEGGGSGGDKTADQEKLTPEQRQAQKDAQKAIENAKRAGVSDKELRKVTEQVMSGLTDATKIRLEGTQGKTGGKFIVRGAVAGTLASGGRVRDQDPNRFAQSVLGKIDSVLGTGDMSPDKRREREQKLAQALSKPKTPAPEGDCSSYSSAAANTLNCVQQAIRGVNPSVVNAATLRMAGGGDPGESGGLGGGVRIAPRGPGNIDPSPEQALASGFPGENCGRYGSPSFGLSGICGDPRALNGSPYAMPQENATCQGYVPPQRYNDSYNYQRLVTDPSPMLPAQQQVQRPFENINNSQRVNANGASAGNPANDQGCQGPNCGTAAPQGPPPGQQ